MIASLLIAGTLLSAINIVGWLHGADNTSKPLFIAFLAVTLLNALAGVACLAFFTKDYLS